MCYLRHRLRIFSFHRKVMFRSRDIQVFVYLTVSWFTKSVTSWWVLSHDRVHSWTYLLNHNSLTRQTWLIDRYKQGQYLFEIFWTIWGTWAKFQALFKLATYSNYSVTNYVKFTVFHFLENVNERELKIVNISY